MRQQFGSVSRRKVLGGFAAGSAAILCGNLRVFAQSATDLLFMEPFDLALEYVHEMNAVVGGHFEQEGLNVTIDNARGTSVAIQQVVANQAQISRVGALDLMKASAAQQTPLVSVATSLQEGIFNLVSRASDPISSPAELRGKTIGVASMGGGQENTLNLLLASVNIPVNEVPRQAIGSSAGNVELVKQGRVDGFFATVENSILLRRQNEPVEIWSASQYAPMPGGTIIMAREFTESNPETVTKFVRALRNSAQEVLTADPAKIIERVVAKYDVAAHDDLDFRIEAIKAYNAMTVAAGEENIMRNVPEIWEKAAKLVNDAGIVQIGDVTTLYTNRFLDEA